MDSEEKVMEWMENFMKKMKAGENESEKDLQAFRELCEHTTDCGIFMLMGFMGKLGTLAAK